jgi:hypothetical protein
VSEAKSLATRIISIGGHGGERDRPSGVSGDTYLNLNQTPNGAVLAPSGYLHSLQALSN